MNHETKIVGYRNCEWCNELMPIPNRRLDKRFCHIDCRDKYYKKYEKDRLKKHSKRAYYKHRERRLKEMREYQQKNKESIKAYNKKRYEDYKEVFLVKHAIYRNKNRSLIRERDKIQYQKRKLNPDYKLKERIRHKRYRKQENGKKWTKEYNAKPETKFRKIIWKLKKIGKLQFKRSDFYKRFIETKNCEYCDSECSNLTIDHITPVTKGGTNDDNNLALVCFKCNISKKDKDVLEWLKQQGYKIPDIVKRWADEYSKPFALV